MFFSVETISEKRTLEKFISLACNTSLLFKLTFAEVIAKCEGQMYFLSYTLIKWKVHFILVCYTFRPVLQ